MDKEKNKKSPVKKFSDSIKANKNMFFTKIKILKQLKANGNDINIDTIQRVFNIYIINTNPNKKNNTNNKKEKQQKKNNKKNNSDILNYNENKKDNIKHDNTKKIFSLFFILCAICVNIAFSNLLFIFNSLEFNDLNEQLTAVVNRTIESPQTDIFLKSIYEEKTNSIIYFYEIVDNLDSYNYHIKNTDMDHELKLKLLKKIFNTSKEIKNINSLDFYKVNSISMIGDSYIIDNKYIIKDSNISGKDINTIIASIKNNNIKQHNIQKRNFLISSNLLLLIIEWFILLIFSLLKKHNLKNE